MSQRNEEVLKVEFGDEAVAVLVKAVQERLPRMSQAVPRCRHPPYPSALLVGKSDSWGTSINMCSDVNWGLNMRDITRLNK